jgi:hypothetical protein
MAFDNIALICSSLVLLFFAVVGIVIFFKLARVGFKWLLTIVLNSVVGVVLFFLLHLIGINIPLTLPYIVPVAIFGIPALATMLLLKLLGIPVF